MIETTSKLICSNCHNEIEGGCCSECGNTFEHGGRVYCEDPDHYCEECYNEYNDDSGDE